MKLKWTKVIVALALSGAIALGSSISASACMGVYVGKGVSQNGSSFIGRSEDIAKNHNKIFTVHPAEDHQAGDMFTDGYGFSIEYPAHTYRYSLAKDSPLEGDGDEAFAEVGINEKDVAMTATVSTSYNGDAAKVDPLVRKGGIREVSMTSVILGQATTAREAVELLGKIVAEHGAGECNTMMFSDPNEAWYMEIVSGHQYAAVKMPEDKVAVFPNMMMLGTIDVTDTENVIVSDGLVSLAEENGFLQTVDGQIHVAKTYGPSTASRSNLTRLWQGTYYMNVEKGNSLDIESAEGGSFDLFFEPDHKLSTQEVMKYLGYRGEGTKYDSNIDPSITAIGNDRQAECHVLEMRDGMYSGIVGVEWLAMSRAEFSLYLPYYGGMITETWEGYHPEDLEYTTDSMYWVFNKLNDLAEDDRGLYGNNIHKYLYQYQAALIEQQEQVDADMTKLYEIDPTLAQEKATELGKLIAQDTYAVAFSIVTELEQFIAEGGEGEFVPSVLENNVMPNYSVDRVGGVPEQPTTPSETPSSTPSDTTSSNSSTSSETSPQTGDVTAMAGVTVALVAAGCAVVLKKRKNK